MKFAAAIFVFGVFYIVLKLEGTPEILIFIEYLLKFESYGNETRTGIVN